MALPAGISRVNQFLASNRAALSAAKSVHLVMGNEAADLDSMASSVMYAYYKAQTAGNSGNVAFIPLINVPRADFKLRTEAVYLFREAGIDIGLLHFADEVDPGALKAAGRLKLTLIDHNKLASFQEQLADCVVEILDHHKDEGLFTSASPRIIEPVGSSATLVAEALLGKEELLETGSATLLLGTILLDTVNLDPEAKRATPKDQQIVERLLKSTGRDRKGLFDMLQKEKFNVSALDTSDLLRKDYKEWKVGKIQVGIASVLLPVADWLVKDAKLSASLDLYAKARKLDVLIAMNAYTEPKFTRELVVYCQDAALRSKLLSFLAGSDLGLSPIPVSNKDAATALYAQANESYSRKKLQPLIDGFFAGLS
jgi:exopolyphosphatase